jgi:FkbM family methyltransferase
MVPDLIYDVGMNDGADTAYYLSRGFRVVAIEADPRKAAEAADRFAKEIRANRLHILNIGIAAEDGELPFWICEERPEWSSFDQEIASRDGCKHHQIIVRSQGFHSIIKEFGVPYYLKIDIDGNDVLCIRDLDRNELQKFISMEVTDVKHFALLAELGFKRFKCISQYTFIPMELPPTPEQRRYERLEWLSKTRNPIIRAFRRFGGRAWLEPTRRVGHWTFPNGSSGPFGEDLPGRWLSYQELVGTYEYLSRLKHQKVSSIFWSDKEHSLWSDVHARLD